MNCFIIGFQAMGRYATKQSPEKRLALARERRQQTRGTAGSVVQGSFHQGTPLLPAWNRGSQCTCMSLMALITAQDTPPDQWTAAVLDSILFEGDTLYSSCRGTKTFVLINELPPTVKRKEHSYTMRYHDGYCGTLGRTKTETPFYTLQDAVTSAQRISQYSFLLIGSERESYACLLMNFPNQNGCYIFDSHSRNQHGMGSPQGTSVIVKLPGTNNVADHMLCLARSLGLLPEHTFEVVPCSIHKSALQTTTPPGFYAPLQSYLQQQQQYQTKKEQHQTKWQSKERETVQRQQADIRNARKRQRAAHDDQPQVSILYFNTTGFVFI